MKKNYYVNYINQLSENACKKILTSWVLNSDVETLTHDQLTLFFLQFNYFVNKFPRYVAAMICNSDNPTIRNILTKNLIDELGGDYNIQNDNTSGAHCILYKNFLQSMGISDEMINNTEPLPCTIKFINSCDKIYIGSNIIKALAAFGPGNEGIPKWNKIYNHFKKSGRYSDKDLEFFSLHIDVDTSHSNDIINAILLTIKDDSDLSLVKDGVMEMIDARYDFYTELFENIKAIA